MADQGLFATSNLLVNVLLARWLPPAEYGAFVTAYAIVLLFGVAHIALLSEPMLIFGCGKYAASPVSYFRILLHYHWLLSGIAALALVALAGVLWLRDAVPLAVAFVSLGVASPLIFLSWLARRACYVHSKPMWAAAGGSLYLVLVTAGAVALYGSQRLSVASASMLLAASALAAALWLMRRVSGGVNAHDGELTHATVWKDHWQYGRWATATGFLAWVPINVYYLVLPRWGGLEMSAALKALFNLILPILHSDSALTSLLIPVLVRARTSAGRFRHLLQLAALLLAIEGLAYWVVLGIFRERLVVTIYGESYRAYASLLWLLGLLPLAAGLLNVLGSALRALEQADEVFWSTLISVIVTLTLGIGAAAFWGIRGSVVGMLLSWVAQITAMAWFLFTPRRGLI